ncbi:hypothetical protein BH09ACT8_BH09ACT8_04120 [soil metagenome]
MKNTSMLRIGSAAIVSAGLSAAVVGLAAPAQAELGHSLWATHQNTTAAAAPMTIVGGGTNPFVPFGTNPQVRTPVGLQPSNHDEIDTTNGRVDLPF